MSTEISTERLAYAILLTLQDRPNMTLEEILERIEIMIQRTGFYPEDCYDDSRDSLEALVEKSLVQKRSEIVLGTGRAYTLETFSLTEIGMNEILRECERFPNFKDQVLLPLTEDGRKHLQGILLLMVSEHPGVREVTLQELVSRIIASEASELLVFPDSTPQDSDDTVQAVLYELIALGWIRREISPQNQERRYFTTSEGGAIAPSFRLPGSGEV
jgi:hypothetical protein